MYSAILNTDIWNDLCAHALFISKFSTSSGRCWHSAVLWLYVDLAGSGLQASVRPSTSHRRCRRRLQRPGSRCSRRRAGLAVASSHRTRPRWRRPLPWRCSRVRSAPWRAWRGGRTAWSASRTPSRRISSHRCACEDVAAARRCGWIVCRRTASCRRTLVPRCASVDEPWDAKSCCRPCRNPARDSSAVQSCADTRRPVQVGRSPGSWDRRTTDDRRRTGADCATPTSSPTSPWRVPSAAVRQTCPARGLGKDRSCTPRIR